MMAFVVQYQVLGHSLPMKAGPYSTRKIADSHCKDILGYDCILEAFVEDPEEEKPVPKSAWDRLLAGGLLADDA